MTRNFTIEEIPGKTSRRSTLELGIPSVTTEAVSSRCLPDVTDICDWRTLPMWRRSTPKQIVSLHGF